MHILEELGAFTIDADELSHDAICQGEPAYEEIVNWLGGQVLSDDAEIDRNQLAEIVFSNPEKLARLEEIIHPEVEKKIDQLINQTTKEIVVIEAIKIIDGGLYRKCDSLWVVVCLPQNQIRRLVEKRHLTLEEAERRIKVQSPQEEKAKFANWVIDNNGSISKTRQIVHDIWEKSVCIQKK